MKQAYNKQIHEIHIRLQSVMITFFCCQLQNGLATTPPASLSAASRALGRPQGSALRLEHLIVFPLQLSKPEDTETVTEMRREDLLIFRSDSNRKLLR